MKKIGINKLGSKIVKSPKIKAKPVVKTSPKIGSFKSKADSVTEEANLVKNSAQTTERILDNLNSKINTSFGNYSLDLMILS